ncbi:MAG: DUF2752 domain-containing protein [Flavobacteriales bacterium]|nr:DUF2752 domain-containing protein [Flavobacteriales bacterium]
MKSLTGCDCPGCGMQRSIIKMINGDWVASWDLHPAGIPTAIMVVFLIAHLRWKFSFGASLLKWMFIFVALITAINYIFKVYHYGVCH